MSTIDVLVEAKQALLAKAVDGLGTQEGRYLTQVAARCKSAEMALKDDEVTIWYCNEVTFRKVGPGMWRSRWDDGREYLAIEVSDEQLDVILNDGGGGYYLPNGQPLAYFEGPDVAPMRINKMCQDCLNRSWLETCPTGWACFHSGPDGG